MSKSEPKTVSINDIPEELRHQFFRHLEKEGYTFHEKREDVVQESMYVSVQGLTFLEQGGFESKYKAERLKNRLTIAKTAAAIANAFMILAISIWAVYVSDKTNRLEAQVKTYEDSLTKLHSIKMKGFNP